MSTRNNASGKKLVVQQPPKSFTATVTPADGAGVDTKGYESASFVIQTGSVVDLAASPLGDGTWAFKVQEADTDLNASYADIVESARIIPGVGVSAPHATTGVVLTLNSAAHQDAGFVVGVISTKRYLRIVATAAATPGASLLGWCAVLEHGPTPVTA